MKRLLEVSAIIEFATGIALLVVPSFLASILLGSDLDTAAGLAVARVAGAALVSLAVACWFARRDAYSRACLGVVAGMLVYNLSVAVLLVSLRYGAGMTGLGLLPVSVLHAALAVWCVACLRMAWLLKCA
jgi:hypothetical protein